MQTRLLSILVAIAFLGTASLAVQPANAQLPAGNLLEGVYDAVTGADDGAPLEDALIQADGCAPGSFSLLDNPEGACVGEYVVDAGSACGADLSIYVGTTNADGSPAEVACATYPATLQFHPTFTFDPPLKALPSATLPLGARIFTFNEADQVEITVALTTFTGQERNWVGPAELSFAGLSLNTGEPYNSWCSPDDQLPLYDLCAFFSIQAQSIEDDVATFVVDRADLENADGLVLPIDVNGWAIVAEDLGATDELLGEVPGNFPVGKFSFYNPVAQAAPLPMARDILDVVPYPVLVLVGGANLVVDPLQADLSEGESQEIQVSLDTRPVGPVEVTVTLDNPDTEADDLEADAESMLFTPADWDIPQTVTVTALDDAEDSASVETREVTFTASSSTDSRFEGKQAVTAIDIFDLDSPGVLVECNDTQAAEADSSNKATCTVSLGSTPEKPVIVDILDAGLAGRATASPNFMLFTATNTAPKTFTLTGVNDDEFQFDQTITLTFVASSEQPDYNLNPANTKLFTILDDEFPAIEVVEGDGVEVTEGGAGDSYTLKFAEAPRAMQTATVSVLTNSDLAAIDDVIVSGTGGFVVDVEAFNDFVDEASPESSTITHSTTANIEGTIADVVASVIDDDIAGFTLTAVDGSANEATPSALGDKATVSVVLDSEPTANVVIAASPDDQSTVSPATRTFTPLNWATPQSFTVTAVDDKDLEGLHTSDVTFTVNDGADAIYNAVDNDVATIAIVDNDAAGITISPAAISVNEGGLGVAYTVKATTTIPDGLSVVVDLTPGAELQTNAASVTLTSANALTGVTVSVSSPNDDDVEGDEQSTVAHAVDGTETSYDAYDTVTGIADLAVTIVDNDVASVLLSKTSLTVSEVDDPDTVPNERVATFEASLNLAPGPGGSIVEFTAPPGLMISPTSHHFTSTTPIEFTVTAVDNDVDEGASYQLTITGTAGGSPDVNDPPNLPVTVLNDDVAAIVLDDAALQVAEAGDDLPVTLEVVLATKPSADVTVTFSDVDGQVAAGPLTFLANEWNVPQETTVTAVDDALVEGPHASTLTATGAGGGYGGLTSAVNVAIVDDDLPGILVDPDSINVGESDDTGVDVAVSLTAQPLQTVTVTYDLDLDDQVVIEECSPSCTLGDGTLTFVPGAWNVAQTLRVIAVDDDVAGSDDLSEVVLSFLTASADLDFDGLAATVDINVQDDDVGVVLDPVTIQVVEGGAIVTYEVSLTDTLDLFSDYVVVSLDVDTDAGTPVNETTFEQPVQPPMEDLGCGLLMSVTNQVDQQDQADTCHIDLVFVPGTFNGGDGTGDRAVTIEVYVPEDDSFDPFAPTADLIIWHVPSSAAPEFQATAAEPLPVVRVDNDPNCPADASFACEGAMDLTEGDGFTTAYLVAPIILGSDAIEIEASLLVADEEGTWGPYDGPASMSLQRDCGGVSMILGEELESADLCSDERVPPFDFTITSSGTHDSEGNYVFTFDAAEARDKLLPEGLPASLVHIWIVDAQGRHSDYSLQAQAAAAIDPALGDLLDETVFTPVPVIDGQFAALPGDGFLAQVGLPDAPLFIAQDGEAKDIEVQVLVEGTTGFAPATGGSYNLVLQVDCGPLQPLVAMTEVLDCAGGEDTTSLTVTKPFTASPDGDVLKVTDEELSGLLQGLPLTALHIWVEGEQGMSNYAIPTQILMQDAATHDVADLLDSYLWHPVVLAAGAPTPEPLGDQFVAHIQLPTPAPVISLDGTDQTFTVTVYEGTEDGFVADGDGTYNLVLQVDCGELQPVVSNLVACSGAGVTDVRTIARGFPASPGGTEVVFTDEELGSLFEEGLPVTALHIWVEDALARQSNYAAPTALALTVGGAEAAAAVDAVDAELWHPVPMVRQPSVTPPTQEEIEEQVNGAIDTAAETVLSMVPSCAEEPTFAAAYVCRVADPAPGSGLLGLGLGIRVVVPGGQITL